MLLLALLLLLVALPVVELFVLVSVAGEVGVLETIALLVLIGAAGWWLCKQQGLSVLRRIQEAVGRGEAPSRELADGALIAAGGVLLVLPGFVSDVVALLLLLPPSRAVVRAALGSLVGRRAGLVRSTSSRDGFVDVQVVDTRIAGGTRGPARPAPPQELGPS